MTWLEDFFDAHRDELTVDDVVRLLAVQGLNLSRYARMQRDRARLEADDVDELHGIPIEALRLAEEKLGVEISTDTPDREKDPDSPAPKVE